MKLSGRELILAWATAVVVVLGGTYFLVQPQVKEWKDASRERDLLLQRRRQAERLLKGRPEVDARIEAIRKELPEHPAGKDVTAELLRTLEKTAQDQGVTLTRRDPDKEKSLGDLYEVAITCQWDADLDALVHFLYALQVQGAILDIRQLSVTTGQRPGGRLNGTFTVDCAYTRSASGLGSVKTEPVAAAGP